MGQQYFWQLDNDNFFFENNELKASIINKIINICQRNSIFKDTLADLSLQELLVKIVQSQTMKVINENSHKKKFLC